MDIKGDVVLPGYEAQPDENGMDHSKKKLATTASNLKPFLPPTLSLAWIPVSTEEDSWAYRCRCAFQIVKEEEKFHYSMRQQGTPVILGSEVFPIATKRIQTAMKDLMEQVLNTSTDKFSAIKEHLTSATFASSWQDVPESDCIVTLHYDYALHQDSWRDEAKTACSLLHLRQLNGRSKGCLISAADDGDDDAPLTIIRDTVWLHQTNNDTMNWQVTLAPPLDGGFQVKYEKPETAFYHPNARAMEKALQWMLNRLTCIVRKADHPCRLLEMYCGCGAHTVALAKTGMLDKIMAVELDNRLVQACANNIKINHLESFVHVSQGDAGEWAKRALKKKSSKPNAVDDSLNDNDYHYDILLVDPPRMGLDPQVCQMAANGTFQHFLYISCGRKALLRDLERLSDNFEVVNCTLVDLFPRTDAVETLVHQQRRL
jgi:tRNA (uracil-5-)-methyltransferase